MITFIGTICHVPLHCIDHEDVNIRIITTLLITHIFLTLCTFHFQASGGYNGLSTNIKMEDGMTPSIPTMKVGDLYVSFSWLINKLVSKVVRKEKYIFKHGQM